MALVELNKATGEPVQFKSAVDALDGGFEEGSKDRSDGLKPESFARELREKGHPLQRGPGSPFHEEWISGYHAGYLGLDKPKQRAG